MSSFGGGGSTAFQIFSDGAENQNAAMRKTKREEAIGKPPATKRAALGEISNNTRVQPVRAVKQGFNSENIGAFGNNENVQPGKSAFQFAPSTQPFANISQGSFKIHSDNENAKSFPSKSQQSAVPSLDLHSDVTTLSSYSRDQPIAVDESPLSEPADSPMLLDVSDCQSPEDQKKCNLQKILNVPEYTESIYKYLRSIEVKYQAPPYMKRQQDINSNMRSILVDWLIEVAEEYRLHRETLMLAVNYIDRFLSKMSVNRKKLQLVGAASMFLAAKYEEIYPPEVAEFVYITDNTYTKEEVLKMEHLILKVLSFDVAAPTPNLFCERFLQEAGYTEDDTIYNLTMMLSELTLLDGDTYLRYLPSCVAASCLCLANHTLGKEAWSSSLEERTGYSMSDLSGCVQHLHRTFTQASTHPQQACQDKYKASKLKEVSSLRPRSSLPPGCNSMLP